MMATQRHLGPKKAKSDSAGQGKHRQQHFRSAWKTNTKKFGPEVGAWLDSDPKSNARARCKWCDCGFSANVTSIKNHFETQKEGEESEWRKANRTLDKCVAPASATETSLKHKLAVRRAEIVLAGCIAAHNAPMHFVHHLVPALKSAFPDSPICKGIEMKRVKCTRVITNVIGTIHKEELSETLCQKPTTTKSKVNTSIVVQTRAIKSKQKVLNIVAKSKSIPQTSRVEQLEKEKKPEILEDREKNQQLRKKKDKLSWNPYAQGKGHKSLKPSEKLSRLLVFLRGKVCIRKLLCNIQRPQSLCLNKTFSTVQVKSTVLSGVSEPKASKSESGLLEQSSLSCSVDKSIENEDSGFHDSSGEATALNDDYSDSQLLNDMDHYEADDLMGHLDDATLNKDVSADTEINTGNETEVSAQMSINKAHVSKDNNQKVITNPVGLLRIYGGCIYGVNSDNAPHTPKEKQQ
ncbi:hypothetical protein FOCC_FOCC008345 [Frankliniella occidentalis]|nr:hypothetical protein FOCC_FOCC008345 [Frankliniella occidentalis]